MTIAYDIGEEDVLDLCRSDPVSHQQMQAT